MKTKSLFIALMISTSVLSFAGNLQDKTIAKYREAVNKAANDDWKTFALYAEKCIDKNINLKEANEWLDKSLQISETSYNLRVKGDYFAACNLKDSAMSYYIKAVVKAQQEQSQENLLQAQERIKSLREKN
ncbi:MAG: hypothetical protein K2Q22_17790 [Cytophagales bacterium]|nr:hypothetical protein [Cytophagales bacterium]